VLGGQGRLEVGRRGSLLGSPKGLTRFKVLRHLVWLMVTSRPAPRRLAQIVRRALSCRSRRPAGRAPDVELLDIATRRHALAAAYWLLERWPERFIRACTTAECWSSDLLRDLQDPPFWYADVVTKSLVRTDYVPTDAEFTRPRVSLHGAESRQRKGRLSPSRASVTHSESSRTVARCV
jgi:hypothetical protein